MKGEGLPRERLQTLGVEALHDSELIAILLRTGIQGKSVLKLSEEILEHFHNDLYELSTASVQELCTINGLGEAKAVGLRAAFALAHRLLKVRLSARPLLNSPNMIADYMRGILLSPEKEEAHLFMLDTQNRLIREELISVGILDRTLIHPREIFRPVILAACQSFILCHTHPSGNPQPSQEDIQLTQKLQLAANLMGVTMLDHIIIAVRPTRQCSDYFSFREQGLMQQQPSMTSDRSASSLSRRQPASENI